MSSPYRISPHAWRHCLCLCLIALSWTISAQTYTVSQAGTYNIEITSPTFVFFPGDDSELIPIGFNFDFFGNTYSDCWVGSDGFVAFGADPGGGCCGQPIPQAAALNNLIAPAWTNTDFHSIHYEVFGSAPNRRLVITFDLRNPCDSVYYGQVKLFEGSNVIEIHTQQFNQDQCQVWSATQGIENSTGTIAYFVPGRNYNNTWQVAAGADDVVSFTPEVEEVYLVSQPNEDFYIDYDFPTDITIYDNGLEEVSIGFDFTFFGNTYNTAQIADNGFIMFGGGTNGGCCEGAFLPSAGGPNNFIAAAWMDAMSDWCCSNGESYNVYQYETIGSAPNRRFVVTFGMPESCYAYYYGQIKLFEGSNIIEIHTDYWAEYDTPCSNVSQGIENATGSTAYFLPDRNANTTWNVMCCDGDVVRFVPASSLPQNDAGVSYVFPGPYCEGPAMQQVLIQNFGGAQIDSVEVHWTWDGVPQDSVLFINPMPVGTEYHYLVELDTQNVVFGQTYELKAWTSMPNGSPDGITVNDTMVNMVSVGLRDTFTIGGTNPDYVTFSDALADLADIGVCDTTVFLVRPDTFNEQFIIPYIPGAFGKQVLFTAENGDSASVVIQYAATHYDSNFVIRFDNAYNVTLEKMTIQALNPDMARVIELNNYSSYNTVRHCAVNGYNTTSTGNDYACIKSNSINNHNSFHHITTRDGSYGFYHEYDDGGIIIIFAQENEPVMRGGGGGGGNEEPSAGISITDCHFLDFTQTGISTYNTLGLQIHRNHIESGKEEAWGIHVENEADTLSISNNTILLSDGEYGMRLYDIIPAGGQRAHIFNNMISLAKPFDNILGIYEVSSSQLNIYHNSVLVDSPDEDSYAYFSTSCAEDSVYNNIFSNIGIGPAVSVNPLTGHEYDYNIYHSAGTILANYDGHEAQDLDQWRLFTNLDSNSFSTDPLFVSATDLHTTSSLVNGKGSPVLSSALDIDEEPRNNQHPDPGADEFQPVGTDAGIIGLLSPVYACAPEQSITVALANLGADTLTTVTLAWSINGLLQSPVLVADTLLPEGDSMHVSISLYNFSDQPDTFRIWTEMPNNTSDLQHQNDTIEFIFRLPLNGTYTIGGVDPDFTTISQAVASLNTFDICGPVTFRIRNGTYTEQIWIDSIAHASSSNTITFESESLDSSLVTIQFTGPSSADNYVVRLNGTDYVTFRHLGFVALSNFYADMLDFRHGATHITVEHCFFDGTTSPANSGVSIKALAIGYNEYFTIRNNYFKESVQAILTYASGGVADRPRDIFIENNLFENQRNRAIDISGVRNFAVRNNKFTTTTTVSYIAVDLNGADETVEISGNEIVTNTVGDGMFLDGMNFNASSGTTRVFNNMVKTGGTGSGIRIWNSGNAEVYFNNVNAVGSGVAFELVGGDSAIVRNNVFVANSGRAFSSSFSNSPGTTSDYNDLLTSGTYIGRWSNTDYTNLAAWQTGTTFDSNSMSINPQFVSATDLHVLADTLDGAGVPVDGISIDFDGNPRNALAPDIGADEIGTNDNDAGVLAIYPEMPFARGWQNAEAVVRNYGGNLLDSVQIHWTLNGVAQPPIFHQNDLSSLEEDTVVLGQVNFVLGSPFVIKAWTSLPNGTQDLYNTNDTLLTNARYAAVSDTVTIGGVSPDVADIQTAIEALNLGGVLDSVRFQLRNGTYHAAVSISSASGMGCMNPVVFESESGNASDVVWDNMGINDHTLILDGADGVIIRHLTINSVIAGYHAIDIRNGAQCNVIEHNILDHPLTTSTSTNHATVYVHGANNNDNTIRENSITRGSYGIYWDGSYASTGNVVEHNSFVNPYYAGLSINRQTRPVIHGNTFINANANSYLYGISASECANGVTITANQIIYPGKRGIGIQLYFTNASGGNPSLIANNFVTIGNSSNSYGIYQHYSSYADVLYNTLRISGGAASGIPYYKPYGTDTELRNNLLINEAGGYAMYVTNSTGPFSSDYNDLLTSGSDLVYFGGSSYADLVAWQATGNDSNSITENPMFADPNEYVITSAALNASGTPLSAVITDIEGQSRDTLTPDMGCDEFDLFSDDVGLLSINYPVEPFPSGENTVFIKFVNNGQDTLVSMQVDWEFNGIPQPTYYWTGLLPSGGTYDSLDIGTADFTPYTTHTVKVWVSQPNGVTDGLASNDTLQLVDLHPGLEGVYTIGGTNPDFDSLHIAVGYLNAGGASGPVTFNIRTGTYLETIDIEDFPGSDCTTPVIFQAESGDSTDVIITNLGIDDNPVQLTGADGVIFQYLTLESVNPSFRNVVIYENGAHCNSFRNCRLLGLTSSSSSQSHAIVYSPTGLDTANVFENNILQAGSHGFYLQGGTSAFANTRIRNNLLDQPHYMGIYALQESGLEISANVITGVTSTSGRAIEMNSCHGPIRVLNNDVQMPVGQYGIHIYSSNGNINQHGQIANNFISVGGTGHAYGLQMTSCTRQAIVHNNVHLYSTIGTPSFNRGITVANSDSCHVQNNISRNSGSGWAVSFDNNSNLISDYNCWDVEGSALGHFNGQYPTTLASWKTAAALDTHSLSLNPQFMSDVDLHVSSVLLNSAGNTFEGITMDFDNEVRNDPPDIGADEFDPSIANDAGIFMFHGPAIPFAHGNQSVQVILKNFGSDTLQNADVRWIINGIEQPIYHYTGSLPTAQCDTITIGNYNFAEYTDHDMVFWSEMPNGIPDSTHVNDTLEILNHYPALNGTYTVGGVLPDFNLFVQLQDAINYGGILGDVFFDVRPGTYATQFELIDFPRASSLHEVTFRSATGDSTDVTITRNFASSGKNYTVKLSGAHHILFEDLTLASTQGRILDINSGAHHIDIQHCRFTGVQNTGNSSNHQLIYSPSSTEDSISITNNRFEFGSTGIELVGSGGDHELNHVISHNHFQNCTQRAVFLQNQTGLTVNQNTFRNTVSQPYGLELNTCSETVSVSGNDIRLKSGGSFGFHFHGVSGTSGSPLQVNNNYILIEGWNNNSYGLYQAYGNYVNYNYNTVRLQNIGSGSRCFWDYSSYQNIHLRNNNFANYAGGHALHTSWHSSNNNTTDYCNLYTTGPEIAYYFNIYSDLAALQAGTTQNQNSVSAEPLFNSEGPQVFQAALDGTAQPVAGITTDIAGNTRSATTPDIGALEFTLLAHDIGAKLLTAPETYCGLSNAEEVTIRIQNYGSSTETGFDVAYSLNGSSWFVENVGGLVITPGATADFTFTPTEDLSGVGIYTFALRTALGSDLNVANDTIWDLEVEHIPALTMPVSNMIPTDGETDLETSVSLSWAPAQHATVYDIYVWLDGQSQPGSPQVSNLSQINKLYTGLSYGQTYNWQVVAKNVCDQMVPGAIQQFSVRDLPDLVIDTVIAPPTAFSGETIQLEWQVLNTGPGSTQSQLWSDAVYLSTDATLNTSFDTYLGAVQNLTALDSGVAYTQTGLFTIPNGFTGNYYVFVYADRWNSIPETQNWNNWERTPSPMMITVPPTPDLKVMSVVTPLTTFSGQVISVNATVKNIGTGETQTGYWHDRVYFGLDPLNYAGGQFVISIPHNGNLEPDSFYTLNFNVPIPQGIFGEYYVYVVSDFHNVVFENAAESNNVGISDTIEVILTPPPDLFAYDFSFPDTVHNNQPLQFIYTLENQGGSTISTNNWYDQLYLSQSPVYNTNFLLNMGHLTNYGPLMPTETAIRNKSLTIPLTATGNYYYYLHLDKGQYVFEHTFESNNIIRSVSSFTVVNPDLRTIDVAHPDTATSGEIIAVAWKAYNAGPGHVYSRPWYTRIYLSEDSVFNISAATLLSAHYQNTTFLDSGDTLAMNTVVQLPEGLSGQYFLHVFSDATQQIFENGFENNNVGTSQMSIQLNLPPFPDLVAREMVIPDTVTAGGFFSLQYELANIGMAGTNIVSTDSFYLSFSPTWNPVTNTKLGRNPNNPGLGAGDSLGVNMVLPISSQQTSNVYYLYIKSDATSKVFEYLGENNNIQRSGAFFVKPAPPVDLVMDSVWAAPGPYYSGTLFNLNWKVTNDSPTPASSTGWDDAIYLSVDSILDKDLDIRFKEIKVAQSGLQADQSYTTGTPAILPNGVSGNYYVIAVADDRRLNPETDTVNNANTLRNNQTATPINIILSDSPDMTPVLFSAPSNAHSGQPFEIQWSVKNNGTAAAQNWVDKIYLSTDNVINQGDVLLVSESRSGANLMPGQSFLDTASVFVTSQTQGNFILILKTDIDNQIYEHLGEHNNQISRSISFTAPPPADLLVTTIILPDSSIAGSTISVTWNTVNTGANPVNGYLREIVYLSTDDELDVDDQRFGLEDFFMYLPPGNTVNRSLMAPVSGVSNQPYYALVQTDARNNIAESNDTNNISASDESMYVTIEELFLDSLTADSFYNGQEHYFRLELPISATGRNLRISVDGDSMGQFTEIYLKHEAAPTLSDFDQKHLYPFEEDQELILENVQSGTYYLLFRGHTWHSSGQAVTILARLIDFELLAIHPDKGVNRGQTTIELLGTQMDTMRRVYLVRDSTVWIVSDTIYEINSYRAYATFNLEGQPTGHYTVMAIRYDGKIAELQNAFEIIDTGEDPDLQLLMDYPSAVGRANRPMKITIYMQNAGDSDMVGRSFRFEAPWGNELAFTYEDLISGNTQQVLQIPVEGAFGPPGILPPKGTKVVEVFAYSRPHPTFALTPNEN